MARSEVASDTFDSSIDSNWDNPAGDDMGALTHVGSGQIEASGTDVLSSMRRNTGTYAGDQYGICTLGGNHGSGGTNFTWFGPSVRHAAGATDDAHYVLQVVAANTIVNVGYRLVEYSSAGGQTVLATAGTDHDLSPGDAAVLEVVGSDLEGLTDEGSGEVSRITHTDNTLTSGRPGCHAQKQVAGDSQITAWSGGDITSAQSLTAPLLDDADAFHSPSIDMNLTLPHFDDDDTLLAPALDQNVIVPLLDDADTLSTPTLGQNIAIPLLGDSDGLFAPELGVNLAVPLLADGDSLYTMIVTEAGVQALVVPLLADDDNLIAPALSVGAVSLSLPLLASDTVLYGPGVRPELQMPHLANVSVLFNPDASYIIALPHLDDADVLNAMAVSVGVTTLNTPKLDSLTVLHSPTLSPPLSHVIELFALYHPEIDLDGKLIQVVDLDALLQDDGQ